MPWVLRAHRDGRPKRAASTTFGRRYPLAGARKDVGGSGVSVGRPPGGGGADRAGGRVVEVLPAGDYDWAQLPGAVNLPLKELDARVGSWAGPGRSSCTDMT